MKKAFFLLVTFVISVVVGHADQGNYHARIKEAHEIKILEEGPAAFIERLKLIETAKESIDIEYFIFRPDLASQVIIQALLSKARENIKIRILIDKSPLAPPISADVAFLLSLSNIEIKYFNPITLSSIGRSFHRTHRKFIIVDKKQMITGGRNIGEEYYLRKGNFSFLDRDIYVAGPIVSSVQSTFEDFWAHPLSKKPKVKKYHRDVKSQLDSKKLRKKRMKKAWHFLVDQEKSHSFKAQLESESREYLNHAPILACHDMEFVSDKPTPGDENRLFADVFYAQLNSANESILLETPYFITLKRDRDLLESLLERKVDISLVTNSTNSNNHPMVSNVLNRKIDNWVEKGMQAYFMTGAKPPCVYCDPEKVMAPMPKDAITYGLHSKSAIIDDQIAMVITYNLDPQSQIRSLEMGIVCHNGPEFAQHLKKMIVAHQEVTFGINQDGRPDNGSGLLQGTTAWEKFSYFLRILPSFIMAPLL